MSNPKYKLYKCSKEGFILETNSLEHVHTLLSHYICGSCILTNKDILQSDWFKETPEEEVDYILENAFPEDYNTLPVKDKVDWLLSTACGCEFFLEEVDTSKTHPSDDIEVCLSKLKITLNKFSGGLSLEEYDILYGDIEHIQNLVADLKEGK